jgi:serine/threonine protein phosphatase PrpC
MMEEGRMMSEQFASGASVNVSARSESGRVRAHNEDSVLARFPLFLVADGMGGHFRGDLASSTAIRVIDEAIVSGAPTTPEAVLAAVRAANRAIRRSPGGSGAGVSGTTLTGLVATVADNGDRHWMVLNIGDSRVYRWNGRSLTQLTVDHSLVQELMDAGLLTADEAARHPERSTITRALGVHESLQIDAWLLPDDGMHTFLICSDGVTKELDTARLELILASHRNDGSRSLADAIVEAALEAGGRDNTSAVVVEAVRAFEGELVSTGTGARDHGEFGDTRPRSVTR